MTDFQGAVLLLLIVIIAAAYYKIGVYTERARHNSGGTE